MTSKRKIVFVDRYSATGTTRPDRRTMCLGKCEGMGCYPSKDPREWPPGAKPDDIGYVFVKCPTCQGSGLRGGKS